MFFYVLNRILSDYKPSSILEMGLWESTKFISYYANNYLPNSSHFVIEQSQEWLDTFNGRFKLADNFSAFAITITSVYFAWPPYKSPT